MTRSRRFLLLPWKEGREEFRLRAGLVLNYSCSSMKMQQHKRDLEILHTRVSVTIGLNALLGRCFFALCRTSKQAKHMI